MVVVERYPELKSTENFRDFQAQYEGMENRIAVERKKFNETVADYNIFIRKFPNNMFAGMFNFEQKGYFEAAAGAEKARLSASKTVKEVREIIGYKPF